MRQQLSLALLTAALAVSATPASADNSGPSRYDRVWRVARLYEGDADSIFQSFDLSGRLQLDLALVESAEDEHREFNVRRFRFGFKTVFLEDFTFHVEGAFNPQETDPTYEGLTDAYLSWSPGKAIKLTAGKHSASFTLDGMTSSKRLLTIDRSNLTQNVWFTEEYIPGFSFKGEVKELSYFAGVFSSGKLDPEFGDLKGGEFILLTLGYDFADRLGVNEAILRASFVDNEPEPENGFTNLLKRIYSLNFAFQGMRWGIYVDVSAGIGAFDQSDLGGFYVMPFYRFSDRVELVGRYTFIESDEANGVRFARYERFNVAGRGDRYDEFYLGLNYYFYGHKLKLQNGAQYVDMRDVAHDGGAYSGWAWTTAFRVSW